MKRVKVAIVGASGYSGEELLRLLQHHPGVAITCITSRQYVGERIGKVFPRFAESELVFTTPDAGAIAAAAEVA